jgi:protease IV
MKHRFIRCLLASALIPLACAMGKEETKSIVAVYDLEGPLTESGQGEPSMFDFATETSRPLTMLDLARSLEKAAKDDAVKSVVLDVDGAELDFSQIQEIRRHLAGLRASGKDVWMYTEHLSNGTALLGSTANHFTLMPEADCAFHGIHAESLYFKGMLDKAGVRAEVIHIGDFKSFGETFYRTGPSEEARKQEDALVDSIFGQVVADVAVGRKLAPEKVRAIIDDGSLNAKDLVDAGLADHLMYRTDFVRKLRETYADAEFDREYELPDLTGPEINGLMDVFKLMFNDADKTKARKDFVAVVPVDGDITEEFIAPLRGEILKLAKEPKAKALVLRVNSPGGSALASELLWEATDEWKATGKPFIVSMGGVAASGGYYISCGANRIFAEQGTITGSIGVVGMKFVVGEAMDKLGITSHSIQRGRIAGADSMMRGYTEEEAKLVRDSMLEVYETFKKRVTDGRGKALKGDLEPLAGGRVYSGKQALEIGLVDEIGGLQEAIAHAVSSAKLENPDVKLLPEPKSGLEGLFAKPDNDKDDEIIRANVKPGASNKLRAALLHSGLTEALPSPARASVSRLISRLSAFQNSRILLIGPDIDLK